MLPAMIVLVVVSDWLVVYFNQLSRGGGGQNFSAKFLKPRGLTCLIFMQKSQTVALPICSILVSCPCPEGKDNWCRLTAAKIPLMLMSLMLIISSLSLLFRCEQICLLERDNSGYCSGVAPPCRRLLFGPHLLLFARYVLLFGLDTKLLQASPKKFVPNISRRVFVKYFSLTTQNPWRMATVFETHWEEVCNQMCKWLCFKYGRGLIWGRLLLYIGDYIVYPPFRGMRFYVSYVVLLYFGFSFKLSIGSSWLSTDDVIDS